MALKMEQIGGGLVFPCGCSVVLATSVLFPPGHPNCPLSFNEAQIEGTTRSGGMEPWATGVASLPMARVGIERIFKVSSYPNHCRIL